jgi:hypothetical protein
MVVSYQDMRFKSEFVIGLRQSLAKKPETRAAVEDKMGTAGGR